MRALKDDSPLLSVVIPTYRRPEALRRTLQALAAEALQAGVAVDVVVSDDGSPPDHAALNDAAVAEQAAAGLAVRLVRGPNGGPAAARNAGARAARGPLILFLDDDCAPASGLLAAHLRDRTAGERCAVMGHVAWAPGLPVTPFMEMVVRGAQFNYGAIADPQRVPFTIFYTANVSIWRSDLEQAGWFDASLPPFMEDTEFAYRLVRSGARVAYRREAVVHHEHAVELKPYLERQRHAGRAAVAVTRLHPELFDVLGVAGVADVALREQFYSALLRYAFVCGVEEGLLDEVREGLLTGEEVRGQFERWVAQWAAHQASALRAWRERAEELAGEVAGRNAQLARVVQEKDDQIASLQAQLARFNRLPPVRLYQALTRRLGR